MRTPVGSGNLTISMPDLKSNYLLNWQLECKWCELVATDWFQARNQQAEEYGERGESSHVLADWLYRGPGNPFMVAALDTLGAPPVFRANCSIPKVSMFHHSPATIKEHQDQLFFCCLMFMSGHVGAFAEQVWWSSPELVIQKTVHSLAKRGNTLAYKSVEICVQGAVFRSRLCKRPDKEAIEESVIDS